METEWNRKRQRHPRPVMAASAPPGGYLGYTEVPPPPVLPEVVQQQDPSGGPDSMSGIWWNDSAMSAMIQWPWGPWLVMMFMIFHDHHGNQMVCRIHCQCYQQPWDGQVDCLWSRGADLFGSSGTVSEIGVPSGYVKHSYGKWPFIVDLPIENGDFP